MFLIDSYYTHVLVDESCNLHFWEQEWVRNFTESGEYST